MGFLSKAVIILTVPAQEVYSVTNLTKFGLYLMSMHLDNFISTHIINTYINSRKFLPLDIFLLCLFRFRAKVLDRI